MNEDQTQNPKNQSTFSLSLNSCVCCIRNSIIWRDNSNRKCFPSLPYYLYTEPTLTVYYLAMQHSHLYYLRRTTYTTLFAWLSRILFHIS